MACLEIGERNPKIFVLRHVNGETKQILVWFFAVGGWKSARVVYVPYRLLGGRFSFERLKARKLGKHGRTPQNYFLSVFFVIIYSAIKTFNAGSGGYINRDRISNGDKSEQRRFFLRSFFSPKKIQLTQFFVLEKLFFQCDSQGIFHRSRGHRNRDFFFVLVKIVKKSVWEQADAHFSYVWSVSNKTTRRWYSNCENACLESISLVKAHFQEQGKWHKMSKKFRFNGWTTKKMWNLNFVTVFPLRLKRDKV